MAAVHFPEIRGGYLNMVQIREKIGSVFHEIGEIEQQVIATDRLFHNQIQNEKMLEYYRKQSEVLLMAYKDKLFAIKPLMEILTNRITQNDRDSCEAQKILDEKIGQTFKDQALQIIQERREESQALRDLETSLQNRIQEVTRLVANFYYAVKGESQLTPEQAHGLHRALSTNEKVPRSQRSALPRGMELFLSWN